MHSKPTLIFLWRPRAAANTGVSTYLTIAARSEVVLRAVRRYHRTTMSFLTPTSAFASSSVRVSRGVSSALPLLAFLLCSACASSGGRIEAVDDPTLVAETAAVDVQERPVAA